MLTADWGAPEYPAPGIRSFDRRAHAVPVGDAIAGR